MRGTFRDRHGRWVHGMRWTRRGRRAFLRADERCYRGRRSRVVLTPRRWRQVVWILFTRRWWQKSPVTKESAKETVTPSRAGMPGDSGATVVTNARATYFYTRGCGCIGHPAFPTPSMFRAKRLANLGQSMSRERGVVFSTVARMSAAISGHSSSRISLRSCGLQPCHPNSRILPSNRARSWRLPRHICGSRRWRRECRSGRSAENHYSRD